MISSYAILGLGSNLGRREQTLCEAIERIHWEAGCVLKLAPLFATDPEGGVADMPFLNSAALIQTTKEPQLLMASLLAIEHALGRTRKKRWDNRVIDLDILFMAGARNGDAPLTGVFDGVNLPHPRILQRGFALLPAARVAPNWKHPLTGNTLAEEAHAFLPAPPTTSWPKQT